MTKPATQRFERDKSRLSKVHEKLEVEVIPFIGLRQRQDWTTACHHLALCIVSRTFKNRRSVLEDAPTCLPCGT
jgi:hypothetical protein